MAAVGAECLVDSGDIENEEHREVNYDGAELTNHEAMSNEGDEGSVDKETAPGMCSYLYQQYTRHHVLLQAYNVM